MPTATPTLAELQSRKNDLSGQIKKLADAQATWTDEDRSNWTAVNADYDAVATAIADEQRKETESGAVQKRLAEIEAANRSATNDRRIGLDETNRRNANPEAQAAATEEDRALSFAAWLRSANGIDVPAPEIAAYQRVTGRSRPSGEYRFSRRALRYDNRNLAWQSGGKPLERSFTFEPESRAMSLTGAAGGFTVPQGFMAELERKTLAYAQMRGVSRIVPTDGGNDMSWPTVDDTGNTGELLAEAGTIGASVDPTFAAVTLKAYKYSSKPILVSSELLQDSAFNLAVEIGGLLGERIGRITGTHYTTGDASAKPQGVTVAATAGVTTASATAIAGDEIIGLVHSLDPSYRGLASCGFMMNDSILLYVRKLKDAQGGYLWQPSLQLGVPDRLLGFPVTVNQGMASAVTTGLITMIFAAFEKYLIRDAGPTRLFRLEELYRTNDQTGFVAFERHDGRTIQAAAIKKMTQL